MDRVVTRTRKETEMEVYQRTRKMGERYKRKRRMMRELRRMRVRHMRKIWTRRRE